MSNITLEYVGAPVSALNLYPLKVGADGAPLLIASNSSLAALKGTVVQKDPRRVSANIWVTGLEPFAEHAW